MKYYGLNIMDYILILYIIYIMSKCQDITKTESGVSMVKKISTGSPKWLVVSSSKDLSVV